MFMKLAILILIATAHAQTVKVHSLKFTAGSLYCTLERREPAALTGLHMECVSATSSIKQEAIVSGVGLSGQFGAGQDTLKWTIQSPSETGAYMYKITANGKAETGSL